VNTNRPCPLCGAVDGLACELVRFVDGRCALKCPRCENAVTDPPPRLTAEDYQQGAGNYEAAFTSEDEAFDRYAREFLGFVESITGSVKGKRMLEIGCGSGNFVAAAAKSGAAIEGIEIDKSSLAICKRKNLPVYGADVMDWLESHREYYDSICMSHVLEHVSDPMLWLRKLQIALKPNAVVCFAQPNYQGLVPKVIRRRWYGWSPSHHYWHFSPRGLEMLLKNAALDIAGMKVTTMAHDMPRLRGIVQPKFFVVAWIAAIVAHVGKLLNRGDQFYLAARHR